jgi:hypothetical protein
LVAFLIAALGAFALLPARLRAALILLALTLPLA